jgi:hypothetical protein
VQKRVCGEVGGGQGRILVEIAGEVDKNLGEVQRSSLEQTKVNDMAYTCSVHMYQLY